MRRALELARLGPAYGANPQVGCVILAPDGRTLGEGYHRGAGTPHAEIAALHDAARRDVRGATVVVTLEPCAHQGKTGPCVDALIEAGIGRVVFGVHDPNPQAAGGAAALRAAGIDVLEGLAEAECLDLIARWALAERRGRPHVTLKLAMSLDGRIAARDGTSQWITGEISREHAHRYRADMDAIVIGTGTLLADDPSLTARPGGVLAVHQPDKIVLGDRPVPAGAAVHGPGGPLKRHTGHDLHAMLAAAFADGARRVLVEGGATIAGAFCAADLVDEFHAYIAPVIVGDGLSGIAPFGVQTLSEAIRMRTVEVTRLGEDTFIRLEREA